MGRPTHESKPDQEAGFKGSHEPSSREHPKWRVGNGERTPLPRSDEREPVRLTGQWRHTDERYHLFINQAGEHIQILLTLVANGWSGSNSDVPRDKKRITERCFRLGGFVEIHASQIYHLYYNNPNGPIDDQSSWAGTLTRSNDGKMVLLDLDTSPFQPGTPGATALPKIAKSSATRIGNAPNLFEDRLLASWVPVEVRTALWFPLTPTQRAKLPDHLWNATIQLASNYLQQEGGTAYGYAELVERYYKLQNSASTITGLSLQTRQRMANIASALDELVKIAHSDSLTAAPEDGGIEHYNEYEWRLATVDSMNRKKLAIEDDEVPASVLTHTYGILDGVPGEVSFSNFEKYLHLRPSETPHEYEAELEMIDIASAKEDAEKLTKILRKFVKKQAKKAGKRLMKRVPLSGFVGVLTVSKKDPGAFTAHYGIAIGGLGWSPSAGASSGIIKSKGASGPVYGQAWRPEHIPGSASFTDASVYWSGPGSGTGASGTLLQCHGSGSSKPRFPLGINFSGLADIFGSGAGAGAGFMRGVGLIMEIDASGGMVDPNPPGELQPFDYGVHSSSAPLHFPINGAQLTTTADELLEIFAAIELAVLSRKGVQLTLHGYADQPHDALHNAILSRNRAITVYNYLKNILEDDLATPELGSISDEATELAEAKIAKKKGQPHSIDDPSVPGVRIKALGESTAPDVEGNRTYDSRYRRVDLYVDGEIRLMLRRKDDK